MSYKGLEVPTDKTSKFIKWMKEQIKAGNDKKDSSQFSKYKSSLKNRLNELTKDLFSNEPDLLKHFGGQKFTDLMESVNLSFRVVVEQLIKAPKKWLLEGTKQKEAFDYIQASEMFKKSKFFQYALPQRDPTFSMITDQALD